MKKVLILLPAISLSLGVLAQPKVVNQAIIKAKTEIEFPENPGGPGAGPAEGDRVPFGGARSMEASNTLYYKGDMTKVESTSDFGNNIVITDRKNKKTTTLMEAMGRKTGFYTTEEDEAAMRLRMDSVRNARRDSLQQLGITFAPPSAPEIEYTNETKKIAGYNCKKAIVKTKGRQGEVNETTVWYSPDFKMAQGFSLTGGGMARMAGINGLDKIEGFPMEYEVKRNNGMRIHVEVIKVQIDAPVDDKEFEIPKGFDVKPAKDMQGGQGRMFRQGGN